MGLVNIKTWHIELIIISVVLVVVTAIFKNDLINWITTLAIIFTFQHAQISDRLQERQTVLDKPTVECYGKLNKLFVGKEILWITTFYLMNNYAAIVGSAMFAAYPYWRKLYRKYKPLKK